MKNKILFFGLSSMILISLIFSSCKELKKMTTTVINEDFELIVEVDADESPFSDSDTISINSYVLEEYADNIEGISIEKVTYIVESYNEGSQSATVNPTFTIDGVVFDIDELVLYNAITNQTVYEIESTESLNSITEKLKNGEGIIVTVSGTSNEVPLEFSVKIILETKVTVQIVE